MSHLELLIIQDNLRVALAKLRRHADNSEGDERARLRDAIVTLDTLIGKLAR